ncbi:MAG: aminopeptidase P family protein [Bacteroidetes bacterium]|nr:aminopeptidase P family protein [Bacteroidota bacterium]
MIPKEVYVRRRQQLKKELGSGLALFPGNQEVSYNYPANTYSYRQDSHFLYFFGLTHPGFAGIIDVDEDKDIVFGNDVDIEDIIWMGSQPSVADQAASTGITTIAPYAALTGVLASALNKGRKIHFLPPYRGETQIELSQWLGIPVGELRGKASVELIRAVVRLKEIKDDYEIAEMEKATDIACLMHTTGMKMCLPGIKEQEIAGTMEGIALALAGPVSFPIILSMDGQTLHNHYHGNILKEGRMVVIDAGCETLTGYSSDITRTVPVGGRFNSRQKEVYEAVLMANMEVIKKLKPGIRYFDMHMLAARTLTTALKEIGLMKGDVDEAVAAGAHTLFLPHGLGHMLGMDVHDMEGIGENYVGYDETIQRASAFGTAYLRLARELKTGFTLTVEPGCYFIPALIDQFRSEGKFTDFINYDKVESYKDFGGIRIEDDVLITADGHKVLGKPIPKTIAEIEKTMTEAREWIKMPGII